MVQQRQEVVKEISAREERMVQPRQEVVKEIRTGRRGWCSHARRLSRRSGQRQEDVKEIRRRRGWCSNARRLSRRSGQNFDLHLDRDLD